MSVDWYFVCRDCNEAIEVASDSVSGFSFYYGRPECMKALKDFLSEHSLHDDGPDRSPIVFLSEHHPGADDWELVEWRSSQP